MTAFFLSLSILCIFAFIYPYLIYPIILRLLPKVSPVPEKNYVDVDSFEVALLFCAYNEEAVLPAKLENLRMMKSEVPRLRIYAYSDCSNDGTNQLLREASDILTPVFGEKRLGKVLGMKHLVELVDSDILVFTDANVQVAPGSLERLLSYFSDPGVGAVSASLYYDDEVDSPEALTTTAKVGGLYWRLEEHIKKLESDSGSMMGADGAFFARSRTGYPSIRPDLVDDMAVTMDVIFKGLRCVSAPDVTGVEASVASRSEEFRRKRRIACGSYSTYQFMKSRLKGLSALNRFKFYSHKVTRWFGAYFLAAALLFFLAAAFSAGVGALATLTTIVLGGLFVILGRKEWPPVAPLYEVFLAVVATGIGVWESLSGSSYSTWDPATTR